MASKKKAVPASSVGGRRKTGAVKKKKARGAAKATGRTAAKKAAKKKAPRRQAAKKAGKKTAARTRAAARKKVAARKPPKSASTRKAARASRKAAAGKKATAKKAVSRKAPLAKTPRRGRGRAVDAPPRAIPGLNEEDQIRAAKYLPRDLPKRLFEEDRFMFPESYGVNRVRLLVRDPDWVFAYWDVSPETMKGLAKSLGERALALSRLTLRVLDPVSGGQSDILLPPGARWWYIRTDAARRTYRAEIGITLPSGEFRQLAESNSVVTPRVGPSREKAMRQLSYRDTSELSPEEAAAAGRAERQTGLAREPWAGDQGGSRERGGASDAFGPAGGASSDRSGASDTFRPGASDTFRR